MGLASALHFLKRPRVAIPLVLGLLMATAVALAVKNMHGPAVGTVTTPLTDVGAAAKSITAKKTYSDKLISFDYPSKYQSNTVVKQAGSVDSVKLITTIRRDQYAAIGVVRELLDNDSGLNYRRLHPNLYKLIDSSPYNAVFSKLDSTEYTGFIKHGDMVISISFTSVAPTDLSNDYKMVAGSLQWK